MRLPEVKAREGLTLEPWSEYTSGMAKPLLSDEDFRREVSDRLRRMETRITRFMEWSGFDTEVRRPSFSRGELDIPSDATSLRDCFAAIPSDFNGNVLIVHKGRTLGAITRQ